MTVAIAMGHTTTGAPATLDLEELLATRVVPVSDYDLNLTHRSGETPKTI